MATYLVGLSLGGDVVIYQGNDPTTAGSFNLVGCWSVGGIPAGRRQCTDFGGDILILSLLGIRSLSSLVSGKTAAAATDKDVFATAKIANLFNQLSSAAKTLPGWALHLHPTDNTLLVLIPSSNYAGTQQLAMSFAGQKGWGRYRDVPMTCAGVWNGVLYFGTAGDQTAPQTGSAGALWQNTGYQDFVTFDGSAYLPINFSGLTSYQNQGNALMKKVEILIPETESGTPSLNIVPQALYDLVTNEPAPPAGSALAASGTWDNAKWDVDKWGGDYNAATPFQGNSSGPGRSVAIAFQGQATTRTVVVGFHVLYRVGGLL
jgi:hypothetical protein